jgi:hypothetical protein
MWARPACNGLERWNFSNAPIDLGSLRTSPRELGADYAKHTAELHTKPRITPTRWLNDDLTLDSHI